MHNKSDNSDVDKQSESSVGESKVGYGNPPKATRFAKGQSGNPSGRPKRPIGTSITEIFDGDQMGKNGKLISKREAIVVRMMNDALAGNQKAFRRFLKLLSLSGLKRIEKPAFQSIIYYDAKPLTVEQREEWQRGIGGS